MIKVSGRYGLVENLQRCLFLSIADIADYEHLEGFWQSRGNS